jgi:hypothetical protein
MNKFTIIALLVTAAVAAGCSGGSDKTLTKAEVIKQGTAICKAAEQRVSSLPQPTVEHPFAKGTSPAVQARARRFLTGYADALDLSRAGLAKLKAPEQDRDLLDGYLRDTGAIVAELRTASKAPAPDVEAKANDAFARFDKASSQTKKYGFPKGVCQSGGS